MTILILVEALKIELDLAKRVGWPKFNWFVKWDLADDRELS